MRSVWRGTCGKQHYMLLISVLPKVTGIFWATVQYINVSNRAQLIELWSKISTGTQTCQY